MGPSYFCNGNSFTAKTQSLYWNSSQVIDGDHWTISGKELKGIVEFGIF